jgi:formylmethanofuran dehydrogenase subunit E
MCSFIDHGQNAYRFVETGTLEKRYVSVNRNIMDNNYPLGEKARFNRDTP